MREACWHRSGLLNASRPKVRSGQAVARELDAVIWCTGFRPALDHLSPLGIVREGQVAVDGTRSTQAPGLWLVGYGEWTGTASATLIGVMRTARSTAREIDVHLTHRAI